MTNKVLNQDLDHEMNSWFVMGPDEESKVEDKNEPAGEEERQTEGIPEEHNGEEVKQEEEGKGDEEEGVKQEEEAEENQNEEEGKGDEEEGKGDEEEGKLENQDEEFINNLVDDILTSNELDADEKIKLEDAKQNVEEAQKAVDTAGDLGDKKEQSSAEENLSKQLEELQALVEDLELKDNKYQKDIDRLKQIIDSKNDELSKYEMENASYGKVLDTVKNDDGVRGFVKIYTEYKSGDKGVKPQLVEAINNITKDTLGIDINSLLAEKHKQQQEVMQNKPVEQAYQGKTTEKKGEDNWLVPM